MNIVDSNQGAISSAFYFSMRILKSFECCHRKYEIDQYVLTRISSKFN